MKCFFIFLLLIGIVPFAYADYVTTSNFGLFDDSEISSTAKEKLDSILKQLDDRQRFEIKHWYENNKDMCWWINGEIDISSCNFNNWQSLVVSLIEEYGFDSGCKYNEKFFDDMWTCKTQFDYERITYQYWCENSGYKWMIDRNSKFIDSYDYDTFKLSYVCFNGYGEVIKP